MPGTLPRQVEVLHDGRWLTGWVHAVRRDPGGPWRGLFSYVDPTVCLQWYHWRPETELRALTRRPFGHE